MARQRLRVGIIGAGWVASARHIPAFKRLPAAELHAVYDRNRERAEATARRFGIPVSHNDMDAFLSEGLDIVSICTPPWTHCPLALQALQHGCHVLTEKPMAMSSEEATTMIRAADQAGRTLCVAHNFRFSRSMIKVQSLLEQGKVGEIQQVIGLQLSSPSRRLPSWYPRLPGGLFFDESPHLIYLMQRLLGQLHVEFASSVPAASGEQPLAHVQANLSGRAGSGLLTMSFLAPVSEWIMVVVGSKLVLMIDIFRDIVTVLRSDGSHSPREVLLSSLRFALELGKGFLGSGSLYARRRLLYGHDVLIRRFVDSVGGGDEPPVTASEGAEVVGVMQEILRKASHPLGATGGD